MKHPPRAGYWHHPTGFLCFTFQTFHFNLDPTVRKGYLGWLLKRGQLSVLMRSAPVCLPFASQIFTKHSKAICHAVQTQISLPSVGPLPKRARAAPCWPQHRAPPPHSINMSSCYSLFNRKINCSKLIFAPWKIAWLIVMLQECSLVHYNAKAGIWLSSRGALRLDPDASGFCSWLEITTAKQAWFQGSQSMPADWTGKSFWEGGRHAGNV